jgi:hypothetical protein
MCKIVNSTPRPSNAKAKLILGDDVCFESKPLKSDPLTASDLKLIGEKLSPPVESAINFKNLRAALFPALLYPKKRVIGLIENTDSLANAL